MRLSSILKKISNNKFRKGLIKYFSSLDFDEFKILCLHQLSVISTLIVKYEKSSFFSKNWIKHKYLDYKFNELYRVFGRANQEYILEVNSELVAKNKKRSELLDNINEIKYLLENIKGKHVTLNALSTRKDVISISVLIIDNIYLSDELNNLIEELNKLTKI